MGVGTSANFKPENTPSPPEGQPRPLGKELMEPFEYWSVLHGRVQPINMELLSEARRRIGEIENLYSGSDSRIRRTIEMTLYVMELTRSLPSRESLQQQWVPFAPLAETLSSIPSTDENLRSPDKTKVIKLPQLSRIINEGLSEQLERLEVHTYLRERVTKSVAYAALLQKRYSYGDNEEIKRLTAMFSNKSTVDPSEAAAGRHTKKLSVPVMVQLRAMEGKNLLGARASAKIEQVIRILIAQQEGLELPPLTPKESRVE